MNFHVTSTKLTTGRLSGVSRERLDRRSVNGDGGGHDSNRRAAKHGLDHRRPTWAEDSPKPGDHRGFPWSIAPEDTIITAYFPVLTQRHLVSPTLSVIVASFMQKGLARTPDHHGYRVKSGHNEDIT